MNKKKTHSDVDLTVRCRELDNLSSTKFVRKVKKKGKLTSDQNTKRLGT